MITPNPLRNSLIAVIWLMALAGFTATPVGATTQYSFNYYLGDGSGDYYSGYVYAPDGWFEVGTTLHNQPQEMGGGLLGGYYYITGVQTGQDSTLDRQERITSFYDAYSGRTSQRFMALSGDAPCGGSLDSLEVVNRSTTAESGYVTYMQDNVIYGEYYFDTSRSDANFSAVPIAGTIWLLGSGLLGLVGWSRLRKSQPAFLF
jgi:hypothetical protein